MHFIKCMILLSTFFLKILCQTGVKICVPETLEKNCQQMQRDVNGLLICVLGRDLLDCARKIQQGEADVANMDIRSIYMAGKFFNAAVVAAETKNGSPILYNGVTLIKKGSNIRSLTDLKGKRACFTAYGRTAWQLPLAHLTKKGIIQETNCAESVQNSVDYIKLVNDFFSGGSCAAGNWSSDPLIDSTLKKFFGNLCSRCRNPSACSPNDLYFGYQGAIKCILEDSGDVSFTSILAVKEHLASDISLANQVDLLCPDGRISPLNPMGEGHESCFWGYRPASAFIMSKDNYQNQDRIASTFLQIQAFYRQQIPLPEWYHKTFLSQPYYDRLIEINGNGSDYRNYLGEYYVYAIEGSCEFCYDKTLHTNATWCLISEQEVQKCEDYNKAAASWSLYPKINCILANSKDDCMELLKSNKAHLVTLDGGDVYKGGRYFDLQPVSAEMYGESDASYFAVAVVKADSGISTLTDLRGRRSCHTGIGRTAGWVIPVGTLHQKGLIENDNCAHTAGLSNFFSGGSCVPGANDTEYNPDRSHVDKLCQHCIGDQQGMFKCSRDSKERYSGYAGAFRCLVENNGDVAFVKHTTVLEYTDGKSSDEWTQYLKSSDFRLLCANGESSSVQEYKHCNLAQVPSHYVMTGHNTSSDSRFGFAKLLADSSDHVNFYALFRLFGPYGIRDGQQDLIFKDFTTALKAAPILSSYKDVLGKKFFQASEALDPKLCAAPV